MIIQEKVKDLVVVGEDTSKKAKISQDKLAKLQYLLTKGLYKDPITAVIAEWTNNGIDSVVQAGKNPVDNPVIVTIDKDTKGQYTFKVEDKGTGLDDRDFEDVCMNYLESTKENDNDTIGHFGIGMKSFLSLERSATFTCRKNGVERKYLVYEGPEFVNFDLIYQTETKEEDGVIAELMINNWSERNLFVDKAKAKLAYYDTVVIITDNQIVQNKIHRNELFQWSTISKTSQMHLCLKDVYYTIDWEALGIKQIEFPVAIRLNLGDGLTPTPSRESYITNEKVKALLLDKIQKIAEWFVDNYNTKVKNFKDFIDAYPFLGQSSFYYMLNGNNFLVNPLLPHSKTKITPVKIDSITVREPNDYKIKRYNLLDNWTAVGYTNYMGIMKTESRVNDKHSHIFGKGLAVKVKGDFSGNIKEFMKDKYGKEVMFLRENGFKRDLGKSKEYGPNGQMLHRSDTYRYILDLGTKPRSTWRKHIEEWDFVVSTIVSTFKDETDVLNSKEFKDWLDNKRELQKLKRKSMGSPGYTGLGKQIGDVTLAYSNKRYGKISFKKQAYPISDLSKNKFLTILVTEDDDIKTIKEIILAMDVDNRTDVLRWALVGKQELKKIPKHFQFINYQKFMTRDCKPFQRLASAILYQKTLAELEKVQNYKSGIFQNVLKSLNDDRKILKGYVSKNLQNINEDVANIILDAADTHKLYDLSLEQVHNRVKKNIKKYDFVNLLKEYNQYDTESQKRCELLITQLLLFRKKYYNDLPEGTKIVFGEPEEIKTKENELV